METHSQVRTTITFGSFDLDPETGELRRGEHRVRLAPQPTRILLALLATPGALITREQLRDELWADTTFVDFDQGLNAAVNRLRRTLGDSAENPRYIETDPGRGYRFIGAVKKPGPSASYPLLLPVHAVEAGTAIEPAPRSEPAVNALLEAARPRRLQPWTWAVAASVALACVAAASWRWFAPGVSPAHWYMTQFTAETGRSDSPALSPDGRLIAYSSDRNLAGSHDLYVKQIGGGEPVRLTFDGAGNESPDFSPDGTRIVFVSLRDGKGIYEIPTLGGEQRLVVRGGNDPRYSPDGTEIAFWIGSEDISLSVPGSATAWVVPAAGGPPRQLAAELTTARHPIWAPDGRHLLLDGYSSNAPYQNSSLDWWYVSLDGGAAVATGARETLDRVRVPRRGGDRSTPVPLPRVPYPRCWLPDNTLLFSSQDGDTSSLWEAALSPRTGKLTGTPTRISSGSGDDIEPSCRVGDTLAFTDLDLQRNLWLATALPSHPGAAPEFSRITDGPVWREHASLSADGQAVAFASTQSGPLNIWIRDLATGLDTHVSPSALAQRFPVLNASGTKIAFSVYHGNQRSLWISSPGNITKDLCSGCLRATDWSADEKTLLTFGGSPDRVNLLDIASNRQTLLLTHPTYSLLYARFSPDNRWVSFTARTQPDTSQIFIAPFDGTAPIPESSWIKVSDEGPADWANWSPDGKTLYFTSARDGHVCLWAQRLDPHTHRPEGPASAFQHFHGPASYERAGWSAGGGRLAAVLSEGTSSIWLMSRSRTR